MPFLASRRYNPRMNEQQKKAGVGFWVTVVLVILFGVFIAYPSSYGPAYWLEDHLEYPKWFSSAFDFVYAPLHWGLSVAPSNLRDLFSRYVASWVPYEFPDGPMPAV